MKQSENTVKLCNVVQQLVEEGNMSYVDILNALTILSSTYMIDYSSDTVESVVQVNEKMISELSVMFVENLYKAITFYTELAEGDRRVDNT